MAYRGKKTIVGRNLATAWTVKIEMHERAVRVGVVALVVPREIAGFMQQCVRLAGYQTPGKSSTVMPATGFDQHSRSYLMGAGLDTN